MENEKEPTFNLENRCKIGVTPPESERVIQRAYFQALMSTKKETASFGTVSLCGIVTNYRTFMEDVLEVEEFCQWLKGWDE